MRDETAGPWRGRLVLAGCAGVLLARWCLGAASPSTAPAAETLSARSIVEEGVNEALAVLRDQRISPGEKRLGVRRVVEKRLDFQTLGRLALGASWGKLSEEQRGEFLRQFKEHVLSTFDQGVDQYTDQDVIVAGEKRESDRDWTVQSRIVGHRNGVKREVAKVDFRVRQFAGEEAMARWQVIDVTVEGISMAVSLRSQFQAVMAARGVERLLELLREKNTASARPTSHPTDSRDSVQP